jgi:hypothetical protein
MGTAYVNLSPTDLARDARLAIENTLGAPEILAALAPYGYDEAALTAALTDVEALETLADDQLDAYADQLGATATLEAAREVFHRDTYMPAVKLARLVFDGEPGTLARLGLDGERKKAFNDWLAQARRLYAGLQRDAALQARMTPRGLPPAAVAAALDALAELAKGDEDQEDAKGLAQQSTRTRKATHLRVAEWIGTYHPTCEIALSAHPEWLERLGFLHRTDDPPDLEP